MVERDSWDTLYRNRNILLFCNVFLINKFIELWKLKY